MKIAILDTYYQSVIDNIYQKNPTLSKKNYRVQVKHLLAQAFGTADFYSRNLINLGYQAEDFILNAQILQNRWCRESFSWWQKKPSGDQIFLAQMKKFCPDVVYCQNLSTPGSSLLKKLSPAPKLIVGQIASPTNFSKNYLCEFDLIITSFPHYVRKYRNLGIRCEFLPLAFEKSLLRRLPPLEKKYDLVFVGNNFPHHKASLPIFSYVAKKIRFDVWGLGWEKLGESSHPEPIWGLPMFQIYRQAKIVVNRHIDVAKNYANNMRLFEATGVGSMLITDYKDNLSDYFIPGKEVETYKTKEELVDKVKYYLINSSARERIARNGQKRTLQDHTYENRMKELVTILKKYV